MKYFTDLFNTRLNRGNFFIGLLLAFLVFPAILMVAMPLFDTPILEWFPLVLFIVFLLSISIKRLHDSGRNGYYLLLILVPLVNLLIPYWLASVKGDEDDNKYGKRDEGISIKRILGIYTE